MAETAEAIRFKRKKMTDDSLVRLYRGMLVPRMIEEKMLKLLRQGKVSKWFSGIGQEAISTGVTLALESDELLFPMHRNLAVFTNRDIPMHRLFSQWQGKQNGFTKGRDRSFHFGTLEHHIVGMISHLGPQLALACGAALAYKLRGENKVAVAFTGEGATSEGDFHEAMNLAAVWELPVIFVIENNGYGLSTPSADQFRCENIADKGKGYGMQAITIDGNNITEVYSTVTKYAAQIRKKPKPLMLECMTFRRRGHEEASGTKYVPAELMKHWEEKDPVDNFERFLIAEGVLTEETIQNMRAGIKSEIEENLLIAGQDTPTEAVVEQEVGDTYAPVQTEIVPAAGQSVKMRFVDAVSDGLRQAMIKHENLVLMGQDIAEYGGVFKVTEGFTKEFGGERVRNTPLCESAIIGAGIGLGLEGFKAMIEMQFADFVTCGFNQIVNNAAKLFYRWGQNVDIVVRMPTGGGVAAGPFHSQSNEGWFFQVPGLKIVYPSTPEDAKGLLLAAFDDPNPVMFFEHKGLYRNLSGDVPEGFYSIPIGKARTAQEGTDATIITYGAAVHWAMEEVAKSEHSVEILDLRSLSPLDFDAIDAAVRKTNRVLILHEATVTGGVGAEISAYINEHLFDALDAPVLRVASLDTPVPFAPHLEKQFLPKDRIIEQLDKLIQY